MEKEQFDMAKEIRDRMEDYLKQRGIGSLQDANNKQQGKAFTEFYVRDILAYRYDLDDDLIEEGLKCDGSNDLNIDFIYNYNDTFFIIQSKYKGQKHGIDRDDISGFVKIHSRVTDRSFLERNANQYKKIY